MAIDQAAALELARRSYERGRATRAAMFAAPLTATALLAVCLGTRPSLAVGLGVALLASSWFFLWRGQSFGRAVFPGVLAGLMPLGLALAARSYGHVCTGSECVSLCVPACTSGGLLAGLLIARAGRHVSSKVTFFGSASLVAGLIGALGCSCVGAGGILGLAMGLVITLVPASVLRPQTR